KPGVTLAAAQAEISAIAARLAKQYPDQNGDTGAHLYLLHDRLVRAPQRTSLWTLLAVVGLVLLIACANVANLLLARALGRQKEFSIRLALGARTADVLRQLLTESVLLALIGAAAGAVLAWLAVRAVVALPSFTLPQVNAIGVNGAVLAFTVALAVICGVLFGLAPAIHLARPRLNDELSGAGALAGGRRRWFSSGLIVAEVALSLVLVAAAVLFVQSFLKLRSTELGFDPSGVLSAAVALPDGYPPAKYLAFQQQLLGRLQALPGVQAAALSSELPTEGGSNGYITLAGHTQIEKALVEWTLISPSYFETMHIPLVEGSGYSAADQPAWQEMVKVFWLASAPPTAAQMRELATLNLPVVVNQTLARHFFPGQEALGKRFRQGSDGPWMTIKGIAADIPVFDLGATEPMAQAYFPVPTGPFVVVRSGLPPAAVTASIRKAVAGLDATAPVYNVRALDQVVDSSVAAQSFQERMVLAFAGLALLLAAAGLYGVMAYTVAARTREIGVRMALGASRRQVVGEVLGRGLRLAGLGTLIGVIVALASGRLIASQLFKTPPDNWQTLLAAALVLLAASALACYIPARRAAAVDPNQALRQG
ncbi:MAG: FtsX-like permease family protein, partial [Terriglobales bacterium]